MKNHSYEGLLIWGMSKYLSKVPENLVQKVPKNLVPKKNEELTLKVNPPVHRSNLLSVDV
jgi:hypothetical protein